MILALNVDFPSGKGAAFASIFASIFTRDWAADALVAYATKPITKPTKAIMAMAEQKRT